MNYTKAKLKLQQGEYVSLVNRDTTGRWFERRACWLNSEGEIVHSHPTDDNHGPVSAPKDGNYSLD